MKKATTIEKESYKHTLHNQKSCIRCRESFNHMCEMLQPARVATEPQSQWMAGGRRRRNFVQR